MTATSRHMDLPRGFSDVDPIAMPALRQAEQHWFAQSALSGFQPVQVPAVGFADTFVTGHNASGDRIYRFPDRRGRELALVSDSLPALLRLAANRGLPEQRLSYKCPVFRYERKPRRHFHHLGLMEITRATTDPESQLCALRRLIETIAAFLPPHLTAEFTISNPGIWYELVQQFVPPNMVSSYVDRLRRTPALERGALLRADGAPDTVIAAADSLAGNRQSGVVAQVPASFHAQIDNAHQLVEQLQRHQVSAVLDLNELHASEFHDGLAFILRHNAVVLGDGGSYGRFASHFVDSPTSAYAAVVGLERIADLTASLVETPPAADIAVLSFPDTESAEHADHLAATLRSRGIAVWDCRLVMPLRRHLRDFAELSIPLTVLIGPEETRSAMYRVRDRSGKVHTVPKERLPSWMLARTRK
ncbi:ATP phosphoribosyltransferase regulatory subunit [Nocardia sp. NPDC004654]|uniref:ATP phosphoribosyltransferase regulatory subunit n=1 Tax=Nocardia sp. NPDC004654 TaxID=3154776 RepID=UPI0033B7648C